ncbi:MAG: lysophospholipid acyltransferase family protein [Polyangiaceae bacterium]
MGVLQTLYGVYQTGRASAVTVAESLFLSPDDERYSARLLRWADKVVRSARIDLEIRGREHIPSGEACVVMANHQSFYDIPVLLLAVRGRMTFVAKKELFQVPVFGRAMETAGIVRVDRNDREKAVASLHSAVAQLRRGRHIYIAPEGTRSPTGELRPFKSGGFRMALEAGARILPVSIDGTRHVLPARKLIVQTGQRVVVTVSPPIDASTYGLDRRKDLIEAVRRAIAAPLGQ